jgi:hypothetical protein
MKTKESKRCKELMTNLQGYKAGFKAGSQQIAKEILDIIEEKINKEMQRLEKLYKKAELNNNKEQKHDLNNMILTLGINVKHAIIWDLKKKYGNKQD